MKIDTPARQIQKPPLFYGYVVVVSAFLIMLVVFGTNYSFGVFFNPLLDDLGWSRAVTSGGYAIGVLMGGLAGIAAGRLCDRFGPKITVLSFVSVFISGCFLLSRVTQTWQLYIFYGMFIGLGCGAASVGASVSVSRWFIKRRGLMNGITVAGIGTGTMLMPLLANLMLSHFSWRLSFMLIGALALVVAVPAALLLKRDPSVIGRQPDGEIAPPIGAKVVVRESGLTLLQALHTGRFWILCSIYLLYGFFIQSVLVHLVPHAKSLGIEPSGAALVMLFLGFGSIAGRIVMGGVSDRIGVRYTLMSALVLIFLTFLWLLSANRLWMLDLFAVTYGFGYGALISMQAMASISMFGLRSLGTLVGVTVFVYTIGGAIGPILTGYIFDVTGSYHTAFMVCCGLAATGAFLALALKTPGRKNS